MGLLRPNLLAMLGRKLCINRMTIKVLQKKAPTKARSATEHKMFLTLLVPCSAQTEYEIWHLYTTTYITRQGF